MRIHTLALAVSVLASVAALACTPVTISHLNGQPLSEEELVEHEFNRSTYVVVGDVVSSETITEYVQMSNGRKRAIEHQKATVVVKKSWKNSKREGDKLEIYTDLGHTCNRVIPTESQVLIYATGQEPVELGSVRISALGLSSPDVATLNRLALLERQTSAPNNPLQRTRSKQRASER